MSLSPVIDQRYRLAAADLGGRPRQVMVRQVWMEGLEDLTPLIFFEGVARPLALDYDQRAEMSRITRSHLPADWVGTALVLRPVREYGRETIRLHALEERYTTHNPPPREHWQSPNRSPRRVIVRTLLVILVLALAFGAVSLVNSLPDLTALGQLFSP